MVLKFFKGGYQKVKSALGKTRGALSRSLTRLFSGKIDEATLDELEEAFYTADLGPHTAANLVDKVRQLYRSNPSIKPEELITSLHTELMSLLGEQQIQIAKAPAGEPTVIFVVGVNGNGKTTFTAKLAKKYKDDGQRVLLAAADTFRAAAVDQLVHWSELIGVDIVKGQAMHDPSAVVFDAVTAAKARGVDVLIIDTAGRLHTKTDLMQELAKMKKVCHKVLPGSPHESLLVLDACAGQNAVDQAKIFKKFTDLTGIVLTKLDGSAKGGVIFSIKRELDIPVKFIGIGEGVDDLEVFDQSSFIDALLDKGE